MDTHRQRALFAATFVGLLMATPAWAAPARSAAVTLSVKITGCRDDQGVVRVALFRTGEGFPLKMKRAVAVRSAPIKKRTSSCKFSGLPTGTYAAIAYHDENNNGKLDTSWIGAPEEATGASNGARGRRGPPKFKDASFSAAAPSRAITIVLR